MPLANVSMSLGLLTMLMGFNTSPLNQHDNPILHQPPFYLLFTPMASKAARKAIYLHKLHNHLKNNKHLIIIGADNLCANQTQAIRQGLRGHSSVIMGKNTIMKRSIAIHAPSAGKPAFVGAIPHIVGKVGLILTDCDPEEVSGVVAGYKLQPLVCSSMDIGMCSLWQWLMGVHLDLLKKSSGV